MLALVRPLARALHWAGAVALASMMFLTVADVVLRSFRQPIVGTYELVGFLGALAIGFSLPQTSLDRGQVQDVSAERDIAVLAVVGDGMAGTPGVAARLFGALYEAGVNVRMIDQGSSEMNIIVGIENDDLNAAVKAIYRAFA